MAFAVEWLGELISEWLGVDTQAERSARAGTGANIKSGSVGKY